MQSPLPVGDVVCDVHYWRFVDEVDLRLVVRPGAELEFAGLKIEREEGDIHLKDNMKGNGQELEHSKVRKE